MLSRLVSLLPSYCGVLRESLSWQQADLRTRSEVSKHDSKQSCWLIINGTAYDLTSFVDSHPGGSNLILKYAGKDATEAFVPIHSSDTLEKYLQPQYAQLLPVGRVADSVV